MIAGKIGEIKGRIDRLYDVLGPRFIIYIVIIEHVLQGFIYGSGTGGFIGTPIMYLMKSYGSLTASRIQILSTVAISPWSLKPLFGMVSDILYIGGYRKLPYIFATFVGAIIACFMISFTWPLSPIAYTILLFLAFLAISVVDLLIEARYTEKIAEKSRNSHLEDNADISPDLVTFISVGGHIGQIISILIVGLLITHVTSLQYIYIIPIPFFLFALYPVYYNWLEDGEYSTRNSNKLINILYRWGWYRKIPTVINQEVENEEEEEEEIPIIGLDIEKARENKKIFLLGLIVTVISLISSTIGLFNVSTLVLFIFSLVSSIIMIVSFFLLVDRRVAMIQTFMIIQNLFSISLEGAEFFFFTDSLQQYPEGPHFGNFFYVSVMGIIGVIFAIIGHILYNLFMSRWKYRTALLFSNILFILISIPSVFFYLRWNVQWGIPDSVFVIIGEILICISATWASLPLNLLMLQLCPEGMEATGYALLAGCRNLGNSLAQYQGAYILDILSVSPSGSLAESRQFDNLWIAELISCLLPIIPLLTIYFLIPDVYQTSKILHNDVDNLNSPDFLLPIASSSDEEEMKAMTVMSGEGGEE